MPLAAEAGGWMRRALLLAARGTGLAAPNPMVGCILVDAAGRAVGEGFHQYELRDHAEVAALRAAGAAARGATAYVTLEPCSHHGRTGPCADALIASGVARVVVATLDANPRVRGNGVARLRAAGVTVEVGLLQPEARRLNDAFAKFIQTGLPYVTLKAALSADGFIAPAAMQRSERAPVWLTGSEARAEVQQLRHAHDALMTGIGTVLADDPLLSDRSSLPRRRPLLRVVLDTCLRIPLESRLVRDGRNVVVFTRSEDAERIRRLGSLGVRVEHLPELSLRLVLARLGEGGITSVLVEAGTGVNTSAITEDQVDRLILFESPHALGGHGVPPLAGSATFPSVAGEESRSFGEDLCRTRILKSYWGD